MATIDCQQGSSRIQADVCLMHHRGAFLQVMVLFGP